MYNYTYSKIVQSKCEVGGIRRVHCEIGDCGINNLKV